MKTDKSKDEEFEKKWSEAVKYEGAGHDYYYIKEYEDAAEMHLKAANLFKDIMDNVKNVNLKNRAESNYLIEKGNYIYSKASKKLYIEKKFGEAEELFEEAAELMKKSLKIKISMANKVTENNIINMNIHFLLERASISHAFKLLNELDGNNYDKIIEQFKIASTHDNLEMDFATQTGDFERATRAQARELYCKGQINRLKGRKALEKSEMKEAKERYLKASEFFGKSAKLDKEWKEYKELSKKMLNVADRLIV
ncbi:MAG: hypothetical protein GF329_08120 [Candidatus Lokiarchaeota archaeon]|nr:hypothetical protein [Candidatus Lokiarchaeota archaeon]